MSDRQRHGFVLLLVAGLIAASVFVITTKPTILGLDLKGGVQLVYQGEPSGTSKSVTTTQLNQAVNIMRSRVDQLGVSQPEIQTSGGNQISVGLPDVSNINRAENEVGTTGQLYFYDWEANALTPPGGQTVASELVNGNEAALEISQGSGAGPGLPGGGSTPLYQAVEFAAKQPTATYPRMSRVGPQYYLFGAPGSAACTAAAKYYATTVVQGQHCLLAGPDNETNPSTTRQQAIRDLYEGLPPGVTQAEAASQGQVLVVPQGITVLQAANESAGDQVKFTSPTAQFFVLRDDVALTGNDITNPTESTDQSGSPDVQFGFTGSGQNAFQSVTATIAHRGANVSLGGNKYPQHFAVALGGVQNQLITVPQIDYTQYPDGIIGGGGADITGGFTSQSASDLASELRSGALPVNLKLISESRVSATLGAQALHQGLVAGAVGLLIVALFLVAYYRVLGVIAVAGLAVYALYFYALIKLIPVTLTLPGIAGLILTIGVAADANIVIFERVKEEIRAGRSIRAGIATGYKKGLTAIIDANVVTIMTAFILFVLATAEVQGFAFTLGIGVIVSLFTAVMATQAILMTTADSRTIARPSALGAGGKKREWRFDFMGKSKYFFTMSGVILLIGALAIGGRGLNLGIDFTSGTRITVTLEKPATAAEVQSVVGKAGAADAQVQRVGTKGEDFQIASKPVTGGVSGIENALQNKWGVKSNNGTPDFNSQTVGPTFGASVAHSAVIAIIASLLVISLYVGLRFDWKFAVPVLIALMHDLLITAGVYALTGREVTVDTVAALLTILGYSLYDTIIVFDRVRENIPRMPRAAFSQIVNRSMSEVLTRSIATTSCTLLPIIALLLFGGSTLQDFAFALLIGVASGAYSSIFIASPVLTHWKEREPIYRHRRHRIEDEYGFVAPYATVGSDVEPGRGRGRRPSRPSRLTEPDPEGVSAAEFEQMKRDLDIEREPTSGTSTLTRRLAHTTETDDEPARPARPSRSGRAGRPGDGASGQRGKRGPAPAQGADPKPAPAPPTPPERAPQQQAPAAQPSDNGDAVEEQEFQHAPDEAENDAVAPSQKPARPAKQPRGRNRRHGRRR
jgi:SecD/SecF fusion protein